MQMPATRYKEHNIVYAGLCWNKFNLDSGVRYLLMLIEASMKLITFTCTSNLC